MTNKKQELESKHFGLQIVDFVFRIYDPVSYIMYHVFILISVS